MSTAFSPKRSLIRAVAPLFLLDKPIQIIKWCRFVESCDCPLFPNRESLYEYIEKAILGGAPVDYLEFGVAGGDSLRCWLELNSHPESRFWGFDSFEGLPDDWSPSRPKGTFTQRGRPPKLHDPRVRFEIGLFQDTLPRFLHAFHPQRQVIIHNDSDLYSATLYTLTKLDSSVSDGTIIIFDEFWDAAHEFRAFMDYVAAYRRTFSVIAGTRRFGQVAVVLRNHM